MQRQRLLLALSLALATGCGARGALGQATLSGDCAAGDAGCRRAIPSAPLAVGARLRPDVRIDVAGSLTPVVAMSSSRDDVIAIEDGALVARRPGLAAVLIGTADGTVIDFQHVWVAQPSAIVVERPSPLGGGAEEVVGPVELIAGEQVVLTAALLAGAQRLAGDGDLAWTVTGDAGVVSLLADGATGRRRLVARRAGAVEVTVAAPGVSTTVAVEVQP
jgi:hypothetical protein